MSRNRRPKGASTGGQFAASPRDEAEVSLDALVRTILDESRRPFGRVLAAEPIEDDADDHYVDDDGQCPDCGHHQEPGQPCETCSPRCAECGCEMASSDYATCTYCAEEIDEEHAYYDRYDEDSEDDEG